LPCDVSRREFLFALAEACPSLVGPVIGEDLTKLQDGYILNRNGLAFLNEDRLSLSSGDSLLILSSQAGG